VKLGALNGGESHQGTHRIGHFNRGAAEFGAIAHRQICSCPACQRVRYEVVTITIGHNRYEELTAL